MNATKLTLLTYADDLFRPMQEMLVNHAKSLGVFDTIYSRNRSHLIETDYYKKNQYILDKKQGGGLCSWKPFYILDTLARMDDGDVLLYIDSADWIENGESLKPQLLRFMADKSIILTAGAFPNRMYTKRDCFVRMDCDSPEYWDAIQIEAGVVVVKNNDYAKKILLQWLSWCQFPEIITADENICGLPNFEEFKDIRYDQSILSLVGQKNGIVPVDFMRQFITCNANMPS